MNSINNAHLSSGRLKPDQQVENKQNSRGIATHNRFTKFFVNAFGSGTIKANVKGKTCYLNKGSCYTLLKVSKQDAPQSNDKLIEAINAAFEKSHTKSESPITSSKTEKSEKKEEPEASQLELNEFFGQAREAFDTIFEGSAYPLAKIPHLIPPDPYMVPERKHMTAPVMRGMSYDGSRPYIAIQVDCTTSDEDLKNRGLTEKPKHEMIIFYKNHTGAWYEMSSVGDATLQPEFFNGNFTDPANGELFANKQEQLKCMQELLTKGEAVDRKGLSWRIPQESEGH